MTEACWFCKQKPGDATTSPVIPLHLVVDQSSSWSANQRTIITRYQKADILVPRCESCLKFHQQARRRVWMVMAIAVAILLLGVVFNLVLLIIKPNAQIVCFPFPLMALLAVPVGLLLNRNILKKASVLPLNHARFNPTVVEYLALGWKRGKKP